jgi:thymidylate synthase
MRVIRAPAIGRAHELVVKMILEKGWILQTEDDEATVEFEEVAMQVDTPLAGPLVSTHSRFQQRFVDQYATDLLNGSKAVFEYDYHSRLFDWGERLSVDGQPMHVDQIEYIAEKLRQSPVSRRAIAITWNPVIDEKLDDCPCLQLVQCILRDGKLAMRVIFRSNDMLTAAGANMYALVQLQKSIADRLGVPCGTYTHISLVPHIYYIRDMNDIEPFCGKGEFIQPVKEVCRACGRCDRSKSVGCTRSGHNYPSL